MRERYVNGRLTYLRVGAINALDSFMAFFTWFFFLLLRELFFFFIIAPKKQICRLWLSFSLDDDDEAHFEGGKKHLSEIFIFINYQVFFYCCEIINFNIYLLLTCFFPLAGCCVYVCKFECVLIYTTLYVYFDAIKNIDFNDGVFVAHTVAI